MPAKINIAQKGEECLLLDIDKPYMTFISIKF